MKYYFENLEKQDQLGQILESWLGTPYRHRAGVRGMGTDCIHFVGRVYEEMGFGPYEIPEYNRDWHMHNENELLLDGIRKQMNVERVDLTESLNGDLFLFKFGKTNSHSAIFYKDHLYQAINNIGVLRLHWLDMKWHKRKRYALRMLMI